MRWPTAVSVIALLIGCALLLWSSNNFDPTSPSLSLGKRVDTDFYYPTQSLAMTFAHKDHAKQQCVVCHHNYLDDTGQGLCLDCHQTNQEIAFKIREQFHELCMDCHTAKRSEGEKSGPLRNCKSCHTADHAP